MVIIPEMNLQNSPLSHMTIGDCVRNERCRHLEVKSEPCGELTRLRNRRRFGYGYWEGGGVLRRCYGVRVSERRDGRCRRQGESEKEAKSVGQQP